LAVGAVIAVAAFVGALAVVNRHGHSLVRTASPATTVGSTAARVAYAGQIPATPKISAVSSAGPSSVIRIDPSTNATRTGVLHYEIWRRDTSDKSASWQVIATLPKNLVAARGIVYTDKNERIGDTYAFRVVAVSSKLRSGYVEITVTPAR
jgi:hypothetical protein